ncbi:MAG: 50S ribosomal protein L25 [Syntrophomonadaceae bacterium]|jgi:large subunit ribosomal protein L25|nr:50S ribosomal protein L25 [Syntrophomonadaceae bacterium]
MIGSTQLQCEAREIVNKSHRKQLRDSGLVPGVVYGLGRENAHISLDERTLLKLFREHGSRGILSLQLANGEPAMVLIREVQRHPISGKILHIDFLRIRMDEKLTSMVPIFVHGEEEIAKKGGVLQVGIKEVELECLPADLPDSLHADVSDLDIGDTITLSDIEIPDRVELLSEFDSMVATVLLPTMEEEEVEEVDEDEMDEDAEGIEEEGEGEEEETEE